MLFCFILIFLACAADIINISTNLYIYKHSAPFQYLSESVFTGLRLIFIIICLLFSLVLTIFARSRLKKNQHIDLAYFIIALLAASFIFIVSIISCVNLFIDYKPETTNFINLFINSYGIGVYYWWSFITRSIMLLASFFAFFVIFLSILMEKDPKKSIKYLKL